MGSVLVLSKESLGAPIAHRLGAEGSITKLFFDNQQYNQILLGIKNPTVITSLRLLEQYDLIIDTGTVSSDLVITEGYSLIAGGPFGRRLYEDSKYQDKVISLTGLKTIDTTHPTTSLIKFIVTGWFNSKDFSFYTQSLSFDRLCEGEKGRLIPGMGRVTKPYKNHLSKYFDLLKPLLIKIKFLGPVSISFSLDEDKLFINWISTILFPLETFELYKGKAFDLLWNLKNQNEILLKDEYAVLSRLIVDSSNGEKLVEVEKEAFPHVCYQDLKEDGCSALSGQTVCFVTARSPQVFEARRRAQRTIKKIIRSQGIQYRNDLGSDSDSIFQKLSSWEESNASREETIRASS